MLVHNGLLPTARPVVGYRASHPAKYFEVLEDDGDAKMEGVWVLELPHGRPSVKHTYTGSEQNTNDCVQTSQY